VEVCAAAKETSKVIDSQRSIALPHLMSFVSMRFRRISAAWLQAAMSWSSKGVSSRQATEFRGSHPKDAVAA
jgi:hypothetical protein